ncbi:MAG: hypothetical protein K6D96_06070 [Acetatifactor sp.]|nr:hypothetical protein [Acetatifactor sp.]
MSDNARFIFVVKNRMKHIFSRKECRETLVDLKDYSLSGNLYEMYGSEKDFVDELGEELSKSYRPVLKPFFYILILLMTGALTVYTAYHLNTLSGLAYVCAITVIYMVTSLDWQLLGIIRPSRPSLIRAVILEILILLTAISSGYLINVKLISDIRKLSFPLYHVGDLVYLYFYVFVFLLILFTACAFYLYYKKSELWLAGIIQQCITLIVSFVAWFDFMLHLDNIEILPTINLYPWFLSFLISIIWYILLALTGSKNNERSA